MYLNADGIIKFVVCIASASTQRIRYFSTDQCIYLDNVPYKTQLLLQSVDHGIALSWLVHCANMICDEKEIARDDPGD
jgi:hypothetical protein